MILLSTSRNGAIGEVVYIDLEDNKRLMKLPKCIKEMNSLTYLHVRGFDLDFLPRGMG